MTDKLTLSINKKILRGFAVFALIVFGLFLIVWVLAGLVVSLYTEQPFYVEMYNIIVVNLGGRPW